MRFSARLTTLLKFKSPHSSGLIKKIKIEFNIRKNSIDPYAELLFAVRKILKLGIAKRAELIQHFVVNQGVLIVVPYGIQAMDVPQDKVEELLKYVKSMGASRWWVVN